MSINDRFVTVTEFGDELVTVEQVRRFKQRYGWAGHYCVGKRVLEIGCGTGPGLGHLKELASSIVGLDISPALLETATKHYGNDVAFVVGDAAKVPFPPQSFETVILFETIYYFENPAAVLAECHRLLVPGGRLLVATVNKDVPAFQPSAYSVRYFRATELAHLLASCGFNVEIFGGDRVERKRFKSRILDIIKSIAVSIGAMPKTMKGKRWLKRLIYGRLVRMPYGHFIGPDEYISPEQGGRDYNSATYRVLYFKATRS